jgi:ribonuclease HI
MTKKMTTKCYAWALPNGDKGISQTWEECFEFVKNQKGSRYKKFSTATEAGAWLSSGADYNVKFYNEEGVYFDSGTGAIGSVSIRVTDKDGRDLIPNVAVPTTATNNYGELLACKYALEYALVHKIAKVFGDSRLVISFWSNGQINIPDFQTNALAREVVQLRQDFEKCGGQIRYISGDHNPADLGFHRK